MIFLKKHDIYSLYFFSCRHNMQKVVYVLLQQHAERYWQADHDDESEDDTEDTFSGIKLIFSAFPPFSGSLLLLLNNLFFSI